MFIVSYLIFKSDFWIIKALRVKQLWSLVSNLSLFLWPLLKIKIVSRFFTETQSLTSVASEVSRSVHQQRIKTNFHDLLTYAAKDKDSKIATKRSTSV